MTIVIERAIDDDHDVIVRESLIESKARIEVGDCRIAYRDANALRTIRDAITEYLELIEERGYE